MKADKKVVTAAINEARKQIKAGKKPATKAAATMVRIMDGKLDVEEIAKAAKTTVASVYWYRNFLKSAKMAVPKNADGRNLVV